MIINQTQNMINYSSQIIKSILIASLASQIAQAVVYPGDECCDVYNDTDFQGYSFRLCHGDDTTSYENQSLPYENVWNFKSIYCGKNTEM